MLDKASRPAAGPPTHEPGSPAPGSGPGPLRRRWNRAVRPFSRTASGHGRTPVPDTMAGAQIVADPVEEEIRAAETASAHTHHEHSPAANAPTGAYAEPISGAAAPDPAPDHETLPDAGPATTAPGDRDDAAAADAAFPDDRRTVLQRAVLVGGGRIITPGWRERAAQAATTRRTHRQRFDTAYRWLRRQVTTLPDRLPTRAELVELLDRRPSRQELADLARRHRYLLGGLGLTLLLAAGDATGGLLVADQSPAPGIAYRVALAHPLQLSAPVPSVRRYLEAIDNGERLREQAVVAAAARATLERAKAEAAAAAAGREQPWINSAPVPEGALPPGGIPPGPGGFVLPAPGTFTSGFGSRWGTFHRGIDIAGPIGTPIYAVAAGTVIDAGPAAGFGLWVRIRHDDGTISVYGHMYDFFVSVGERVPAGMQIARMGNRGDSTGPHLHFEIIMDGRHVDPQQWLAFHGLSYG